MINKFLSIVPDDMKYFNTNLKPKHIKNKNRLIFAYINDKDIFNNHFVNNKEKYFDIYEKKNNKKVLFRLYVKGFNFNDILNAIKIHPHKIIKDAKIICNNKNVTNIETILNTKVNIKNMKALNILENKYGRIINVHGDGYCLYRCIYYYCIDNKLINNDKKWVDIFYILLSYYFYDILKNPEIVVKLIYEKFDIKNINGEMQDLKIICNHFNIKYKIYAIFKNCDKPILQYSNIKNNQNKYCVFIYINSHWSYINYNKIFIPLLNNNNNK